MPFRNRVAVGLITAIALLLVTLGWSTSATAVPGGLAVTVVVSSSANPSTFDQDVTYIATLTTSDSGNLDITDTIEFQDNGADISGCSSQLLMNTPSAGVYVASCDESANNMSVGSHNITAQFPGDSTYDQGSGSLNQMVNQAPTTTVITSPSPGSSVSYGNEGQNSLNFTVSASGVANNSPSGSVNLYDGVPGPDTYLCTGFLGGSGPGQSNGNCYINNGQINAGLYVLTATYGGDNNFAGSSSSPQDFNIDQVTSQMQAFPVPGYAFYGAENGNFFITGVGGGNGGNPTGFITITADGTSLIAPNTCSVGNGGGNPCYIDSATVLPASSTPYMVTLSYPGDANFTADSSTVPLSVFPATSSTVLSESQSSASYGSESSVAISANVTSGTTGSPTGSVAVQSAGITLCTISLRSSAVNAASGTCSLSDNELSLGPYSLTANYPGDGNYQTSVSSAQPLTITTQTNHGYWLVGSDGGIFAFGSAQFFGSTGSLGLQRPIVGITPTSDRKGYWLVASDGGVFAFGDAGFYGSIPGSGVAPSGTPGPVPKLSAPIVGMVPSSDGGGYFMVASDGGVFAFGNAHFAGSCQTIGGCQGSVVAIMTDSSGDGYWLVTSTGNVYSFGDALYYGAPGNQGSAVTSAVRTPDGTGYWVLLSNGSVYAYGAARYLGGANGLAHIDRAATISATGDGGGYWVATADGAVNTYGDAPDYGDLAAEQLNAPVIGATGW